MEITRIMVFKGMVFKSKYWILVKNKGFFLSEYLNFEELRVVIRVSSTGFHSNYCYVVCFDDNY